LRRKEDKEEEKGKVRGRKEKEKRKSLVAAEAGFATTPHNK
jgi:hypothetical protein